MPRQIRARSLVPPLVAERQIVSGRVGQRFAHQPATHCNCDGNNGDRPDDEEGSHAAPPCAVSGVERFAGVYSPPPGALRVPPASATMRLFTPA
jgi:hypothetical protein